MVPTKFFIHNDIFRIQNNLLTDDGIPKRLEALFAEISFFLRASRAESRSESDQVLFTDSFFGVAIPNDRYIQGHPTQTVFFETALTDRNM